MATKQVYKDMFENAVHIGHRTYQWNPKMKKYIFGEQNGIHIINLEETAERLADSTSFLSEMASKGKTILFVSTKPQAHGLLKEAASACKMPYVVSKWIPGLLTNFSTVKRRIKYLSDLKQQRDSGEFDKYTKKEIAKLNKTIMQLEMALGGVEGMTRKPDAVVVLDAHRDQIPAKEATLCNIPVVAFVDTNADPKDIDYPIPANDDALTSLKYLVGEIVNSLKGAKKSK